MLGMVTGIGPLLKVTVTSSLCLAAVPGSGEIVNATPCGVSIEYSSFDSSCLTLSKPALLSAFNGSLPLAEFASRISFGMVAIRTPLDTTTVSS